MIDYKKITPNQIKRILELIEEQTRADIIARLCNTSKTVYCNLTQITVDKMDELREFALGSSDLVELGKDWGLLKRKFTKKKVKRKTAKIKASSLATSPMMETTKKKVKKKISKVKNDDDIFNSILGK